VARVVHNSRLVMAPCHTGQIPASKSPSVSLVPALMPLMLLLPLLRCSFLFFVGGGGGGAWRRGTSRRKARNPSIFIYQRRSCLWTAAAGTQRASPLPGRPPSVGCASPETPGTPLRARD